MNKVIISMVKKLLRNEQLVSEVLNKIAHYILSPNGKDGPVFTYRFEWATEAYVDTTTMKSKFYRESKVIVLTLDAQTGTPIAQPGAETDENGQPVAYPFETLEAFVSRVLKSAISGTGGGGGGGILGGGISSLISSGEKLGAMVGAVSALCEERMHGRSVIFGLQDGQPLALLLVRSPVDAVGFDGPTPEELAEVPTFLPPESVIWPSVRYAWMPEDTFGVDRAVKLISENREALMAGMDGLGSGPESVK